MLFVFRYAIRTGSWPDFAIKVIAAWAIFAVLAVAFVFWQSLSIELSIETCIAEDGFECDDARLLYLIAPALALFAALEFLVLSLLVRLIRPAR